ncbi:Sphingosine kinase 2 [Lemmus lemmus]
MAPPPVLPLASSTPILHGEFGSYPAHGPRFALTLTVQALHIQRLRPKPEARPRNGLVPLAEVSGCGTLQSRSPSDTAAYFCVYTYPRCRRGGRCRAIRTFRADGAATYEENRAEAQRWATALMCLLRGVPLSAEQEITPELLPRRPRLLILVNPFGGRGLAWQRCMDHVVPMISEAGLSFNLIQTERQNHARELVQGLSLSEWEGIVTVSGDGLLYEVLNGLLDRPDWKDAVRMPIGVLPCGSGNALAGAINHHGGFEPAVGVDLLLNCSLLLCRGGSKPLDLLSVTLASGSRCFSFLSVAWGFLSDVDIHSERFRALGSARFTLGAVLGLATLHTYRGRLSYLPATTEPALPIPGHSLPRANPPDHLLPPLGSPLPPDWVTIEGEFVLMLAILPSHLGADLVAAPHARFDDGVVHLCWVRSGISRAALLRILLAMEHGNHFSLGCPHLSYAAARAFRLEPLTPRGVLTVDGELVEYGPIQAQVHPSLATLLTGPEGQKP